MPAHCIVEEVPVLIVGGGAAGLAASMLLSQLGIKSLLVNARSSTSDLPKAHYLNQRTMEILADVGVATSVYAAGTPPANMRAIGLYAGLAGPEDALRPHGRKIGQIEAFGAGYTNPDWIAASPHRSTNLPQHLLEPILRRRAEMLAPQRVRFHQELVDFDQNEHRVSATIMNVSLNQEYTVRSSYLLACDGGKTVGPALDIEMEGERDLAREISIHMTADLSHFARDSEVLFRWIFLPESAAYCVLVPMGPHRWGPDSEEWVLHLNYPPNNALPADEATIERDMRLALGIADQAVKIHKITRWSLDGVVASRFRESRIFLLGDAAHRHPPTSGLGLNSAIQDAHNLCWKIAAVLAGSAAAGLLSTYEAERKPVVQNNVARSLENARNQSTIRRALGLHGRNSASENWASLRRLWSDLPEDAGFKRDAARAIATQSMEFGEHNVEYGYTYTSIHAAIVSDGSVAPEPIDAIHVYRPSTIPGHPLPHSFLDAYDGRRLSTLDLVQPGRFLLIAGESGQRWCDAARKVAANIGIALDAVSIGHAAGDYLDPRCSWLKQREIHPEGAVLVRPDRFVAWRSVDASAAPDVELERTLRAILRTAPAAS